MTVTVRLFAALRELLGSSSIACELEPGSRVADLIERLTEAEPDLEAFDPVLRVAVNDAWSDRDTVLADGDEVALLTPVSGG